MAYVPSYGLKISRNLTVTRPSGKWIEAQVEPKSFIKQEATKTPGPLFTKR